MKFLVLLVFNLIALSISTEINETIEERVKQLENKFNNFTSLIDLKLNKFETMIDTLMDQRLKKRSRNQDDEPNKTLAKDSIKDGNVSLAESQCNDWQTFRDIKCFKIFENYELQNFEDAIDICHQQSNDTNLVIITSADEQVFLSNFLFNSSQVVDNVWIGAKYFNSKYEWINEEDLTYTNWAEGHPKNITNTCVQINSDLDSIGKWVDVSCKRKNKVVCQKLQSWPMSHMQEKLLNFEEKLSNLNKKLIPLGFIYVQLPNEKTPTEIWPSMTWIEITSSYAGLFFRAEGGNSSSFGRTQEENVPRITQYQSEYRPSSRSGYWSSNLTKEWSEWVHTGSSSGTAIDSRLFTSGGEVRPRNTAIRVWKRYQ